MKNSQNADLGNNRTQAQNLLKIWAALCFPPKIWVSGFFSAQLKPTDVRVHLFQRSMQVFHVFVSWASNSVLCLRLHITNAIKY